MTGPTAEAAATTPMTPMVGLSLMPQAGYLATTLPLFEAGEVDVIEWSFDMAWRSGVPDWLASLVADYEAGGRLIGHGVSLSPLSEHPRQHAWFDRFTQDAQRHRFAHVSEHFGFMAAGDFRLGPPMPLPMTEDTLRIGRAHLERLGSIADAPVGIENLAFAFGTDDVWTQGDFLDALLEPVDGFLVLDVHNLWCQITNFGLDAHEVLATYPVDRVRECHVSGGSWSTTTVAGIERNIRRDTHDDGVPDEVFVLLADVLDVCPNVETVIVEQIGDAFGSVEQADRFRRDYSRTREVAARPRAAVASRHRAAEPQAPSRDPVFPAELMRMLDEAPNTDAAIAALHHAGVGSPTWRGWVDGMDPHMVATAQELMATWARRN